MANEISYNLGLSVANGSLRDSLTENGRPNQSTVNPNKAGGSAVISHTAAVAIGLANLTTPGWARFKNIDPTNFITLGAKTGSTYVPFAKLLPGESCLVRLGTTAPYALADTADAQLQYDIYDV